MSDHWYENVKSVKVNWGNGISNLLPKKKRAKATLKKRAFAASAIPVPQGALLGRGFDTFGFRVRGDALVDPTAESQGSGRHSSYRPSKRQAI